MLVTGIANAGMNYAFATPELQGQYTLLASERWFENSAVPTEQQSYPAVAAEAEVFLFYDNSEWVFQPLIQYQPEDDSTWHGDLRQLLWRYYGESLTFNIGFQQFFWGSLETANPVNELNQWDMHTGLEKYDRLGMPAVTVSQLTDEGELTFIALTGFREREFLDPPSRPNYPFAVEGDSQYESSKESKRLDLALRWYGLVGESDVGLAAFSGIRRSPLVKQENGRYFPFYPLTHFIAADVSYASGNWLWKTEAMLGYEQKDDYQVLAAGAEYTLTGVFSSRWDLGLIAENYYDSRDAYTPGWWQNDLAVGMRLSANNTTSSELKLLLAYDWKYHTQQAKLEFTTRLNEKWQLNVLGYGTEATPQDTGLLLLDDDNHLKITVKYYLPL